MNKKNRVLEFLKHPHGLFLILLCLLTVGSIAVSIFLVVISYTGPLAYVSYILAAVSLAYSIYVIVHFSGSIKQRAIAAAKKRDLTRRFVENYGFRTVVFAVVTSAINIGYAVFYGVLGIVAHSLWHGALAGYYIFLSAVRCWALFSGLKASKQAKDDPSALYLYKLKIFRGCGIFLIVLDVALSVVVTQMVFTDSSLTHGEIMAIASAAYAFYKIALAVINLFKAKNWKDPLVQSLRNISLTDALVSLFALQTTLVALYSVGDRNMTALNIVVGAIVCAATVGIGVYMIVRAGVLLRRRRRAPQRMDETEVPGENPPAEEKNG